MMERIKEEDKRVVQGAMVGKETVEHTLINEMSSVVEVFIDEVSRVVTEFSNDSSTLQGDEVSGDIPTIDEELIGTEASRSMTELSDDSHLQLTGGHVLHVGLSMEEQSEARVESMMDDDVQPSFGLAIDEGQHRDHTLGFQHSLLKRHTNGICSVVSPPLCIGLRKAELSRHTRGDDQVSTTIGSPLPFGERETELPSQISCVDLDSEMRQSELHKVQHPHVGVVLCARVHAFDPSLGVGWQAILSWYPVEWTRLMEMVIVWSKAQWELLVTEGTRGPG